MSECIFCQIIEQNTATFLYEDDQMIVIKDIYPKAPIHLLAIPKKHIQSFNTLTPDDAPLMAHMISKFPQIAEENGLAEGYRTVINTGAGGGQVVPHIHFHLMGGGKLRAL